MAVAVSFSPANPKLYTTCTASVTGATASTAYYFTMVDGSGHTKTINFKTDGSGNASVPFVLSVYGSVTATMYPSTPTSVWTASAVLNTSGH